MVIRGNMIPKDGTINNKLNLFPPHLQREMISMRMFLLQQKKCEKRWVEVGNSISSAIQT